MESYKMAGRFLGWRLTLMALVLVLALSGTGTALAVHMANLFELDRNAVEDSTTGDDWATLQSGGGSANAFTDILADIASPGTQFHGGGSKDNNDISSWLWNPGEPLDKDDITNAYAAAYFGPGSDLIVYYGLDRFANNGSAQVGFWFLQDQLGLTNTPSQGGFKFSGFHKDGDILVQSNFTNGGTIDKITVYKWQAGALVEVFPAADCESTPIDTTACAVVNRGDQAAPWPYTPKFGTPGTFPAGSFFEGGVNLTQLLQGDVGCFTTFIAETRSSTPFDSRLKDFALGNFALCDLEVVKEGDDLSKVGDDVAYTITLTNTGQISLDRVSIIDDVLGDLTDGTNANITSSDCGPSLAAGASCTIELARTVLAGDPDPLVNTVTAVYGDGTGTKLERKDTHSVNLFQPSITLDKDGDTLSKVGDDVAYTITLKNTSSIDTPDLECTITDALLGIKKKVTLAAGASDLSNPSYTVQGSDPDPLVNTASASCSPIGFPNVLEASGTHSVNLFQPAVTVDKGCAPETAAVGDTITYSCTINNTSSADSPYLILDSVDDTIGGDQTNNAAGQGCGSLAPNTSCKFSYTHVIAGTDPDPLVNTVTVHYHPDGFTNDIAATGTCTVDIVSGCALSPGFWGGGAGRSKWDNLANDPIAQTAGFQTTTLFPWAHQSLGGLTYLGVFNIPALGDVTRQLAFKYVAARLNEAAFGVPSGVDVLLDDIDVYLKANPVGSNPKGAAKTQGQALFSQINAYFTTVGEEFCPNPSAIPEG